MALKPGVLFAATFGGLALHLLVTGWLDLTSTEAWLLAARWMRFPVVLLVGFVFCLGMELALDSCAGPTGWRRWAPGMLLHLVVWLALIGGVFYLHSGEILLVLLSQIN